MLGRMIRNRLLLILYLYKHAWAATTVGRYKTLFGRIFFLGIFFLINCVHVMAKPIEWDRFGAKLLTIE